MVAGMYAVLFLALLRLFLQGLVRFRERGANLHFGPDRLPHHSLGAAPFASY